jgi:hypothetical protein
MLGKLLLPIIDLGEMEYDENFEHEVIGRYGEDEKKEMYGEGNQSILDSMYSQRSISDDDFDPRKVQDKLKWAECECYLSNADNVDIDLEYLHNISSLGKMSILRININPNSMDYDCETEMKFWLDDSRKLLDDKSIDNQAKIRHLPVKTFTLDIDGERFTLSNCKLFKFFNVNNAPYSFAVIIEKIN